jgi:hypothetical protein
MQEFELLQSVARSSTLDLETIQRDVTYLRNQINKRNEFLSYTLAAAVNGRQRLELLQRSQAQEAIRLQHEQVCCAAIVFKLIWINYDVPFNLWVPIILCGIKLTCI